MNIKLAAIDVDGTLIDDHGHISLRTKIILKKLNEQGVKVVISTGRAPIECIPILKELPFIEHIIAHNGGMIYHSILNKVLLEIGFNMKEIASIIHYLKERDIPFIVSTPFHLFVDRSEEVETFIHEYRVQRNFINDLLQLEEKVIKLAIHAKEEDQNLIFREMNNTFPDRCIMMSGEKTINVMHPNANKGLALQSLAKYYNILMSDIIAFGNYYNDIEMLQMAGIGVAVMNAPPAVKAAANITTDSNNMDGVAKILEELYIQQTRLNEPFMI